MIDDRGSNEGKYLDGCEEGTDDGLEEGCDVGT